MRTIETSYLCAGTLQNRFTLLFPHQKAAVTRNSDFFRERSDQANIQLPDGGILINPLFDPKKISNSQNSPSNGNSRNLVNDPAQSFDYEKTISNQAEIIDALEDTDLSTRFKIIYASMAAGLTLAQPNQSFEFPWPPDDKDAPKKILKKEEVEAYCMEHAFTQHNEKKELLCLDFQDKKAKRKLINWVAKQANLLIQ